MKCSSTYCTGEGEARDRPPTPSLEELKKQQAVLQEALRRAESDASIGGSQSQLMAEEWQVVDSYINSESVDSQASAPRASPPQQPAPDGDAGTPLSPEDSESISRLALTPHSYRSASVTCGTPVVEGTIEETVKIRGIPDALSFAKDITEHIPYENIAGATGTFDRMRGLLKRVRDLRKDSA